MGKTYPQSMTGHQQPFPSSTKTTRNNANHQRQRARPIFVLMSVPISQPGTVSNSTPPQDSHSAMWQ